MLLDDDLKPLQPLERIAGRKQGGLLAGREFGPPASVDHPLRVIGVGKVRGAVHCSVLGMLTLHVAVAGELVLELGLGDCLELGLAGAPRRPAFLRALRPTSSRPHSPP
jgi:hypothetical protein